MNIIEIEVSFALYGASPAALQQQARDLRAGKTDATAVEARLIEKDLESLVYALRKRYPRWAIHLGLLRLQRRGFVVQVRDKYYHYYYRICIDKFAELADQSFGKC